MSKFAAALETYVSQSKELNLGIPEDLLSKVAKGLGPSIYNVDSSKVAGSDKAELDRIKNNFLIKKLGLKDSPDLDNAIKEVIEKLGSGNRNKYRAVVYALLAQKFGKESIYK